MNTPERLRFLREKAGYSQQTMADMLNIGRTTYVKYETGDSKPTRKLAEIAAIFNVSVDFILGNELNQNRNIIQTNEIYTKEEREIIKKYRQLDTDGKNLIAAIIDERIAQLKLQSKNTT